MSSVDLEAVLQRLTEHGVEFIVIGGIAALAHGAARATFDVDVVYRRTPENFNRLVAALSPLSPYLRGAPPGLPFQWDTATIERGLNFTLTTSIGPIDLLGEVAGGGTFEQLDTTAESAIAFGVACRIVDLKTLIRTKRAAGRPKDIEAIAELELLLERQSQPPPGTP